MSSATRGYTLIELAVTLAILGVAGSLAVVAFQPAARADTPATRVQAARSRAIALRRPIAFQGDSGTDSMMALPDGRVLGDPSSGVDLLTGRVSDPR